MSLNRLKELTMLGSSTIILPTPLTLRVVSSCILIGALLSMVTSVLGQSIAAQRTVPSRSGKVPVGTGTGESLKVDAIQPLFLDASQDEQTLHFVGDFPKGTVVGTNSSGL